MAVPENVTDPLVSLEVLGHVLPPVVRHRGYRRLMLLTRETESYD